MLQIFFQAARQALPLAWHLELPKPFFQFAGVGGGALPPNQEHVKGFLESGLVLAHVCLRQVQVGAPDFFQAARQALPMAWHLELPKPFFQFAGVGVGRSPLTLASRSLESRLVVAPV